MVRQEHNINTPLPDPSSTSFSFLSCILIFNLPSNKYILTSTPVHQDIDTKNDHQYHQPKENFNPSLSRPTRNSFFSTTKTHPHIHTYIYNMTVPVTTSSSPSQGPATTSSSTPATAVNGHQEPVDRPASTESDDHPEIDDFVKGFYDGMSWLLLTQVIGQEAYMLRICAYLFLVSFLSTLFIRWWILGCRQPCLGHLDLNGAQGK